MANKAINQEMRRLAADAMEKTAILCDRVEAGWKSHTAPLGQPGHDFERGRAAGAGECAFRIRELIKDFLNA